MTLSIAHIQVCVSVCAVHVHLSQLKTKYEDDYYVLALSNSITDTVDVKTILSEAAILT